MVKLDGFVPWPAEFAARYRARGYWTGETFGAALRRYGRDHGDSTALVVGDRSWSYRELDAEVDRYVAGLLELGIAARERVVVQLPNCAEFVVATYALLRLGAIPVFALPAHRSAEIEHFVGRTGAVAYLIADGSAESGGDGFDYRGLAGAITQRCDTLRHVIVVGDAGPFVGWETLRREPVPVPDGDPSDVAVLLLSGGTTGLPKFVARTHDDWAYSGRAVAEACGYTADTRHMVCLPLGHNWTLTHGLMATFHAGGRLLLAASPDPAVAFPTIEQAGVTETGVVPGVALAWVETAADSGRDLSSLRRIVIGGSKLPAELARRVEPALGCVVQQAFGMAEGLCGFQRDTDDLETRLHAQGRPVSPDDELLLVDENGLPVPGGEVGELLTRGPYTVRGYYRGGPHNRTSFTDDGFYRTGDLVRLLPDGQVVFTGRVKDQINRGGEKIAAEEVENHLLSHPAIREVALVGVADEVLGERSCAFVISGADSPKRPEVARFLTARGVAAFKIPDLIRVVDTLPRTPVGKVDKKRLRETL